MMFIVDGTGEEDLDAYDHEMANGFCRKLEKECRGMYWRGPTVLDWSRRTTDLADEVVEAVRFWRKLPTGIGRPLFLAGHSRGGAAVIFAARTLFIEHGIDVDAMFLFGAVDRATTFRSAAQVPRNVKKCYHAMRDNTLAFELSDHVTATRDAVARLLGLPTGRRPLFVEDLLDSAMKSPPPTGPIADAIRKARDAAEQDAKRKLVMRAVTMNTADGVTVNFANCGTEAEVPKTLITKTFAGSHGALGGAPIIDQRAPRGMIDSDRAAMACVKSWMWGFLAQDGALRNG